MANAAKHSRCSHLRVQVATRDSWIELKVDDDGRGFDPGTRMGSGLGLISMRERADLLGGTFSVNSSAGRGTTVRARIPLSQVAGNTRRSVPSLPERISRCAVVFTQFVICISERMPASFNIPWAGQKSADVKVWASRSLARLPQNPELAELAPCYSRHHPAPGGNLKTGCVPTRSGLPHSATSSVRTRNRRKACHQAERLPDGTLHSVLRSSCPPNTKLPIDLLH